MTEAFFLPDGDRSYLATEWTRGPWSPEHQHAGPPSALLGRAIESCAPSGGRIVRCTTEILRPVPIGPVSVAAEIVRPGRNVALLSGELAVDGQPILKASAWWLRTTEGLLPPTPPPDRSLALPEVLESFEGFPAFSEESYFHAMEWRFAAGGFFEPGPAAAWMRMRFPLVIGEQPSPLVRVLTAADSGNGISGVLPMDRYVFVNTDLSVHLQRYPIGEWVLLDAQTTIAEDGIGLTSTVLGDATGPVGRSTQTLFVAPR
jgi:hypothetical protein